MTLDSDGTYSYDFIFQTNNANEKFFLDSLAINGIAVTIPTVPGEIGSYLMDSEGNYLDENRNVTTDDSKKVLLKEGPNNITADKANSIKVTDLGDGASVTVNYVRVFNDTQRVYQITIKGAKGDMTITNGNLMMYQSGAPEYTVYYLDGVHADFEEEHDREYQSLAVIRYLNNEWKRSQLGSVEVTGSSNITNGSLNGDPKNYYFNIKFKLKDGYQNPEYTWSKENHTVIEESKTVLPFDGNKISDKYLTDDKKARSNNIYGPDPDGWYYIRLEKAPVSKQYEKFLLLSVSAQPIKYMVHYLDSKEVDKPFDKPSYDHDPETNPNHSITHNISEWGDLGETEISSYDDYNGRYYDVVENYSISINNSIPVDLTGNYQFAGWKVVDINDNPILKKEAPIVLTPGMGIDFNEFEEYTVVNDALGGTNTEIRVLRLLPVWNQKEEYFNYDVKIAYKLNDEDQNYIIDNLEHVDTKNLAETGETLEVSVDIENKKFIDWIAQHPYYAIDINKNEPDSKTEWDRNPEEVEGLGNYKALGDYRYKVTDNGTIYIYMDKVNGALNLTKEVEGIPTVSDGGQESFEFKITTDSILEDTYYAWPAGNNPLQNTSSNATKIKFNKVNNKSEAVISVKAGESYNIYLPAGTYTVEELTKENNNKPFSYTVYVNDELRMKNGILEDNKTLNESSNVIVGEISSPLKFKNDAEPILIENHPKIKKTINGTDLGGTFKFKLKPSEDYGNKIEILDTNEELIINIPENVYEGTDAFKGILFKQAGEYKFQVSEILPESTEDGYFIADSQTISWTVKVINNNGKLEIEELDKSEIVFTNNYIKYENDSLKVPIKVSKILNGRDLKAGEFSFKLENLSGQDVKIPVVVSQNNSALEGEPGIVDFGFIEIQQVGNYTFKVSEIREQDNSSIEYDDEDIVISFEVTKNSDGKLEYSELSYENNKSTFINQETITSDLTVNKILSGTNWDENYNFSGKITLVKNTTGNKVYSSDENSLINLNEELTFDFSEPINNQSTKLLNFKFNGVGQYTFLVEEVIPENSYPGISYDSTKYLVTYDVQDNNGLTVNRYIKNIHGQNLGLDSISFKNIYSAEIVKVNIEAVKILVDEAENQLPLDDQQFTFALEDLDKNNHTIYSNALYGYVDFGSIEVNSNDISKEGLHYKLYEVKDDSISTEYQLDDTEYFITITVEKTENGLKTNTVITKGDKPFNGLIPEFKNIKKSFGSIKISKFVDGNSGETDKEFHFNLKLENSDVSGKYGDLIFTNGSSSFTLKHNESKFADSLPADLTYTVTETEADQDGYITTSDNESGVILNNETRVVKFINTKNIEPDIGSIKISKKVVGTTEDQNKEFNFTLTITGDKSDELNSSEFEENVASFTLKHNEDKVFENIPAGASYLVEESEANQDGFTTTTTGASGTVIKGSISEVEFTNTRNIILPEPIQTGNLKVSKEVTGNAGDKTKEFNFTLTLNGSSNSMEIYPKEETIEFTLKDGEVKLFDDIPVGTAYTVVEVEANKDSYTTTARNFEGIIEADKTIEVDFINHKEFSVIPPSSGPDHSEQNDGLAISLKHKLDSDSDFHSNVNSVDENSIVDYQILVKNNGDTVANNILVGSPLAQGLELIKATPLDSENISNLTSDGNFVSFEINSLDIGESEIITYQAKVSSAPKTTYWINHAFITEASFVPSIELYSEEIIDREVIDSSEDSETIIEDFLVDSEPTELSDDENTSTVVETTPILLDTSSTCDFNRNDYPEDADVIDSELAHGNAIYSNHVAEFTQVKEDDPVEENLSIKISKVQKYKGFTTTDPIIVTRGENITYIINVENPNSKELTNINISDIVPKGLEVINDTISNNGNLVGTTINWHIEKLEAGQSIELSFDAVIENSKVTEWNNKATVSCAQIQDVVTSNEVVANTPIITILKEQSTSKYTNIPRTKDYIEFKPGDIVTYYLTIKNEGDVVATNLEIGDYIPEGLTLLDEEAATTGMMIKDNYFYWTLEKLEVGDQYTFQASFQIPEVITEKVFYKNIGYVNWKENGNNDPVASNEVILGDPPSSDRPGITDSNDPTDLDDPVIPNEPDDPNKNDPSKEEKPGSMNGTNNEVIDNITTSNNSVQTTQNTKVVNGSPKTGLEGNNFIYVLGILIVVAIVIVVINITRKNKK